MSTLDVRDGRGDSADAAYLAEYLKKALARDPSKVPAKVDAATHKRDRCEVQGSVAFPDYEEGAELIRSLMTRDS